MEGELRNERVEERREGQINTVSAAGPLEVGRENTVICEGPLKPQFSPSDSVLTDSGVSEMTNTESDYSDSLEQDDEDAKTPLEDDEAEERRPSLSPSSKTKSEGVEFEDSGDASWFDQDGSDFFIDANLTHDNGIVEFDPNSEDFTNWDSVKSFFEGLIERQNTELDRISSFDYEPETHDSYTPCRSLSADEAEMKPKAGFRLFDSDDDRLLDTIEPFPSGQLFDMHGAASLSTPKVIQYNFEMHDESWGYSSHEPYFDAVTGQRILSTIYEFEVSSDEDTESVKVVDASWHELEPAGSERRDAAIIGDEGQEGEEGKEEDADENICGKETKQNEEAKMWRGNAGGGHSSSAANTLSGAGGTPEAITLTAAHNTTSVLSVKKDGREEASEGVVEIEGICVNNLIKESESNTQAPRTMTGRCEDLLLVQSENPNGSGEGENESHDQEYENLVTLDNTAGIRPEQVVGTLSSTITGHAHSGLEVLCPTSDAEAGAGGGDEGGKGVDEYGGTGGCGGSGDKDNSSSVRKHETLTNIASEDAVSPQLEPVFRDCAATAHQHPKIIPDSPPAAEPLEADGETQGHLAPPSPGQIYNSECVGQKASLSETSKDRKDTIIFQTTRATTVISSLDDVAWGTSRSVVSPEHHSLASVPVQHASSMQEEDASHTENNDKSGDEATLTRYPFTCLSPADAAKDMKEDEARPTGLADEPDTFKPPLNAPSSEFCVTKHPLHTERDQSDEQESTDVVEKGKDADVTSVTRKRKPEPPPRPHRRTHSLTTSESPLSPDSPPVQLTRESDGGGGSDMGAPGDCMGMSGGVDGWGVSGSSQGHPHMHTPDGSGREEEATLLENCTSAPDVISQTEEKEKKENEKQEKKREKGSVPNTLTLIAIIPLQQQQQQVATITTITGIEAETSPLPRAKVPSEGLGEDTHAHRQKKPAHTQPLDLSALTASDSRSATTTTITTSTTTATTTTAPSPLKPIQSSRTEMMKLGNGHVNVLKYESSESDSPKPPPARPARRKQTNTARSRKAMDSEREEEAKQNKDSVRPEVGTPNCDQKQISDSRSGSEQTAERREGSDSRLERLDAEASGSESINNRLRAGGMDPDKAEQGSSDSRLEREKKIYLDDRLNGSGTEAEGERGSDSGSGGEGEEGEGDEEQVVEGSGGDTLSTQYQKPSCCVLPAANTNNPDDSVEEEPVGETVAREGDGWGSKGVARKDEEPQLQEKDEPVFIDGQSEAEGKNEMEIESDGGGDGNKDKELPPVPSKSDDNYSKHQSQKLCEERDVKATTGSTAVQVPPPRRRRNPSISRSLHQEDAATDASQDQPQTAPIAPVRKKRQFSSLPRPPKTKTIRDVSPSLSTSALALVSPQRDQTCTTSLRAFSNQSTPESSPHTEHNGVGKPTLRATGEVETNSDPSRRLSEGSTQSEKKRRSLKRTLKRTGSLKDRFYTRIQQKLEKSSRRQTESGSKIKYFSRIFHRKQKLYDMSDPSHYPSEIPIPAPPPEHLSSEDMKTFTVLLSSHFAPGAQNQSKSNEETRSKYTTLEHSAVASCKEQEHRTLANGTPRREEHLPATTDNSETTALLQESLVSSSDSLKSLEKGLNNDAFVNDESEFSIQDSPRGGDSGDEPKCERVNDSKESCPSPEVKAEAQQDSEESCSQSAGGNSKELESQKDAEEEAHEPATEIENEEAATLEDRQTSEAIEDRLGAAEEHLDLEDVEQHHQDVEQHHQDVEQHHQDVEQHYQDVEEHHQDVEQHQQDVEQHHQDVKQHHQDVEQHHQDVEQHHQDVEQHQQDVEQHHQDVKQHHQDVEQHHQDVEQHHQDVEQHHQDVEQHHQDVEQHHQDVEQHQQDVEQHHQDVEQHHQDVEEHHQDVEQHQNVEQHHQDVEQHHQDVEQHHQDVEQHHQDVEQHHQDVEPHHQDFEVYHQDFKLHQDAELHQDLESRHEDSETRQELELHLDWKPQYENSEPHQDLNPQQDSPHCPDSEPHHQDSEHHHQDSELHHKDSELHQDSPHHEDSELNYQNWKLHQDWKPKPCHPYHPQDSDHCLTPGEHTRNRIYRIPTARPSVPPPPPPPADEESYGQEKRKQVAHTWERPTVSLRTWAERQGIETLTLPPLHLREHRYPDLDKLDYYYDSDSSEDRDTPSPGPPVDAEKEGRQGLLHKQKREEDRTQKDRCVEVYPETVRQRQRNMMAANNKVDIKNWNSSNNNNNNDTLTSPSKSKKFLPSVKALRSQFEAGKTSIGKSETNGSVTTNGSNGQTLSRKSSSSSVASISQDVASTATITSLHSPNASVENLGSPAIPEDGPGSSEPVEPIFNQFRKVDQELRELMSKPHSTSGWDPRPLLKRLYYIPEAPKIQSQGTTYVNIEGYLEKLPSGRKKATFWNAWKRRYFMAKNGILYYYQSAQTDKPSMKMTLMGGKVECMEPNMVGVDDGKGHYVVVRCSSRQEAERWRRALETHTVEDFTSQYVQPWPMPTNPTLLRDTIIVDIGSASIRAGVLASQATLPQVFIPSVVASGREGRGQVWGMDALAPDVRASSSLTFPIRPTHKISKYSVDLSAVSSLLQKAFAELKVDPKNYHIQLSVPRVLNTNTQAELLRVLFDKFGVRSINLTHQSILALYAYNATSGIVVDVGERMDIVPVIDGYIVDGGVSRVPYGGYRILDHLRQFLYMRNISCINEVESYIIRQVLENICYCAHHYNTEKARCTKNPENFEKSVSLAEYCTKDWPYESISLDFGRFQATEGLFNPDAWGLDHPGLHKLVHKAIMECSMDIRKEMSRSIFLAGGVTQLPGLVDRLTTELDNLTPPAIRPKVHASPYRYHAAYIGACVLAESPAFTQSRISQEDWNKHGNSTLRKWSL
ncbi:serine-rich adhesin for platelets-like isoform X2 [Scylla paramamosain]|uniref:serine-rich adhesin for platelets-like isoform X2 n=1 Tax=Scylla paramamosain TaxID=85552 RepID=UPI00308395F2